MVKQNCIKNGNEALPIHLVFTFLKKEVSGMIAMEVWVSFHCFARGSACEYSQK
jgi:hypothetical protein